MSKKITSIPYEVGDKIQYEFSNNNLELFAKYANKPTGGMNWTFRNCKDEMVSIYKTLTVIESTKKSRFLIVEDENGNRGTFVYKKFLGTSMYTPSKDPEDVNEIPLGEGVYRVMFWANSSE